MPLCASHFQEYLLQDLSSKFAWFTLYFVHLASTSIYASPSYSKNGAASKQKLKAKQ